MASTSRIPILSDPIQCIPSMLPNTPNHDFPQSTFFKTHPHTYLPSPSTVRALARSQYLTNSSPDKRKHLNVTTGGPPHWSPPAVAFASLNLFVKWGADVRIAEGQSLYAVRHLLGDGDGVRVPDIYGWRTDAGEVFLYMELVQGQTLEVAWEAMTTEDRERICTELGTYMSNLRLLRQDPQDPFIGTINRAQIYDRALAHHFMHDAGPFPSVKHFHDWSTLLCRRHMSDPYSIPPEPFRSALPDDAAIRFTHGDLHRSNIIISVSKPYHVIAIVDWEQSGWFPEYWEERKARWTADWESEWATRYLPMILKQYDERTAEAWDWYISALGH